MQPSAQHQHASSRAIAQLAIAGGKFLYGLCALATTIAWGIFNSLAAQTAISRILFAMSRDGMMPKALAKVHPTYKTPYVASCGHPLHHPRDRF